MRPLTTLVCCLLPALTFSLQQSISQNAGSSILFEGARLIAAAKQVVIVKFWVDDRNGAVKKLPPNLYRVIITQ